MGRVILEHPDGRRIAADESDMDDPVKNPYNHGGAVVRVNANDGSSSNVVQSARPADDHVSLLDEGFVIVADVAESDSTTDDGVTIHAGHEVPRDEKLYRGEGLRRASKPSDIGRRLTRREPDE